jgi:hypothetical protein
MPSQLQIGGSLVRVRVSTYVMGIVYVVCA